MVTTWEAVGTKDKTMQHYAKKNNTSVSGVLGCYTCNLKLCLETVGKLSSKYKSRKRLDNLRVEHQRVWTRA